MTSKRKQHSLIERVFFFFFLSALQCVPHIYSPGFDLQDGMEGRKIGKKGERGDEENIK